MICQEMSESEILLLDCATAHVSLLLVAADGGYLG